MSSPALDIRPPYTPDETDACYRLIASTFVGDVPVGTAAADWRRFVEDAPDHDPSHIRGAFQGATCVGGYLIDERWLRIGPGRLRAGCIGGVVTHPDHRHRGIGSALMRDARAYARERGHAVLLLNGALHFYDPFGYIDVFDATEHSVSRADILAQPPSPDTVRPATMGDAPALLALHRRHYGPYIGSFERTLAQQEHHLGFVQTLPRHMYRTREGLPQTVPHVALGPDGDVRGYLGFPWGPLRAFGCDVAAVDWPAALALLQHHATLFDAITDPPGDLCWTLPPDSMTCDLLADHLPVQSVSQRRPHAGWMACPINVEELLQTFRLLWQERWRGGAREGAGAIVLAVEGDAWTVEAERAGVRIHGGTSRGCPVVSLTRQLFTQVLFGHRPGSWLAIQPDARVPVDALPLLDVLFPRRGIWIAPSDGC